MSKRVYIAYTGGTIGMRASAEGYTPEPGYFEPFLRKLPELTLPGMPHFEIYEYPELLDSANMVPENWNIIAADIARNYQHFDGFVVLHGTDTMAHTAAALSFMLEGLTKPVILTGSQIPLCEIRNDGH